MPNKMRNMVCGAAVTMLLAAFCGCGYTRIKAYERPPQFRQFVEMKAGEPAPDFVLNDISGGEWRLSKQKDKLVVLQFCSATSPPFVQGLDDFRREVLSPCLANPQVLFVYVFGEEAHPELLDTPSRLRLERDAYQHRLEEAQRYYYRLKFHEGSNYDVAGLIPAATNVVLLVDTVSNPVGPRYGYGRGGTTNPAFLIDRDGVLVAKGLFAAEFVSSTGYRAGNLAQMIGARMK